MTVGRLVAATLIGSMLAAPFLWPAEPGAAERGQKALLGRNFTPPTISLGAYQNAWRRWGDGATQPPEPYAEAFLERYGLHPAPYANGGYPMGLRASVGLLGRALSTDCLLCHGGSILGQSYVGLPNSTLDIQALFEGLSSTATWSAKTPF